MPQRLSDAQMKFLSEFAPKSLAKKRKSYIQANHPNLVFKQLRFKNFFIK